MSTEMNLVYDFMNVDVPADELPVARAVLEDAISAEVEQSHRSDMPTGPRFPNEWCTRS